METKLRKEATDLLIELIGCHRSIDLDGDVCYDINETILLDDIIDNIDVFVKLAKEQYHYDEAVEGNL